MQSAPPGQPAGSTPLSLPQDTVQLSGADPADRRGEIPRVPVALALGWSMMAASRLLNMVPSPAVPAIVCATTEQSQSQSRLRQVLSCEKVSSPQELQQSIHRASYAWEGLRTHTGQGLHDLKDRPGAFGRITAWPYGQVMAASLDQAKLSGDYSEFEHLVQGLERLRHPEGGYASSKGPLGNLGARFYDDNAWLGLVFVQAAMQAPANSNYLRKAEEIAAFLRSAQQPDGGLLWEEGNPDPSYNSCTFGPSIELSLRLYQLTSEDKHLEFARDLTGIMESRLRMPNGLYADLIKLRTGELDPTVYSYNQGTPVGAHRLWYEITGDTGHLEKARETASAALRHFGQDGLWQQSPAFNAVFFRNLMTLQDPAAEAALDAYLEQAWSQALDPETGLFQKPGHGMGSYEGHAQLSTIDQAGLVQLYALRDWSSADRNKIA
jgi:hypothetical protein